MVVTFRQVGCSRRWLAAVAVAVTICPRDDTRGWLALDADGNLTLSPSYPLSYPLVMMCLGQLAN